MGPCTVCNTTFSSRAGTLFYRRSTDEATIICVLTLLAHGCPPAAIEPAFGVQRQTVRTWQDAAGSQSEAIHRHLVCQPRDLGAVQADEIRVRQQGRVVWVAMAMQVVTRLWLGGAVSPRRDGTLIARLSVLVKACALPAPLLVLVDGFAAYVTQVRRMARSPEPRNGKRGRCQLREWRGLVIGQVVKRQEAGHVVGVTRRLAHGTAAWAVRLLGGRTIQDGLHRTTQWHLPRPVDGIGPPHAGRGTDGGTIGAGDVGDRHHLQLLHAARQPRAWADARDGGGDHRSLLECGRGAALPCSSVTVATAEEMGETHESGGGAH